MHRPTNTHPGDNDAVLRDTDNMESLGAGVHDTPDSASSAADAGLIDPNAAGEDDLLLDAAFDEGDTPREIPMSDLEQDPAELHMAEMSDMDAPGEIDIEELDESAIEAALPPDARLDPLEP